MPTTEVQILEELSYEKSPYCHSRLLNKKQLRNKDIASIIGLWQNRNVEEMMWGAKEEIKSRYLHLNSHSDYFHKRYKIGP